MASNGSIQHFTSPHHCKECGLHLNSAESLEVHLQYHKENLLNKWATQAATSQHGEETNNNNTKGIKREFLPVAAAADSSDMNKKSPENFAPPTPQSYQSASSPYQNNEFSPSFQSYALKQERASPSYQNYQLKQERASPSYQTNYAYDQFYVENNQNQFQDYQKPTYRYHPYHYERPQITSSNLQPTPSPSPKQCDKCGFVCDSSSQLLEHQNMAHPFYLYQEPKEEAESEILDLDSHKVHQVFPEEEKRNGDHSVTTLLNPWPQQQKMYQQQQYPEKMYQDFHNVTTTSQEMPYHLQQPQPSSVISSSAPPPAAVSPATKSANWKSNEARRPKTYNCTACNKWFTSSGHLKRHYNTTLHKNAVKSSGQPDPASMPISAHHHPAREPVNNKEEASNSPHEEDTNSSSMPMPGLLPQYDRPPVPMPLTSSPPNGEAGPSPTTSLESRGLHPFPQMSGMMPLESPQYPTMPYPNGSAPHVTQPTATNSLNITGEYQEVVAMQQQQESQPLPSFAQFHRLGLMMGYGNNANVGGGGSATAPYCYYPDPFEATETRTLMYKTEEDEYRLTVLTAADPAPLEEQYDQLASSPQETLPSPHSPEKAHIKRDYEEGTGSPQITSTVNAISKPGLYKCIDCDKTFNKACYLTQHNKTFHCGDKPFKCGRCGKRFSSEETHEEHASKHAGDKPHKCDRCPKQFNHKTDLRRHMCLHTGQKPFVCDTCGKGFIRKDHMLKHCETHFRKTHGKVGK